MPALNEIQQKIQTAANSVRAQMTHENIFQPPREKVLQLDPNWKEFPHRPFPPFPPLVPPKRPEPTAPPAPPPLPSTIDFQSGPITFSGGTPVGGWCNLRLYQNGNYEFWGHFHDSGAPSYDAGFLWFIVDNDGQAYTFERKVHLNGTFESGSRDGDWNDQGNSDIIAQRWPYLCAGWHSRWTANVNWDWNILIKQTQDAVQTAGTIVKSVMTIVALF